MSAPYKRFNKLQFNIIRGVFYGVLAVAIIACIVASVRGKKIDKLKAEVSDLKIEAEQTGSPAQNSPYVTNVAGEIVTDANGLPIVSNNSANTASTTYKVIASEVNLRSVAAENGTILVKIPQGAVLTVTSTDVTGNWGATSYEGKSGWVSLNVTDVEVSPEG
ncbi:MAG TPA: hypothetical protein GXZ23_02740 [Clostridiales bacterium]|jgi:predicted regulator of Ras-like GTPase activity (Roadblock/LC7/MglB family)|nr:hypothetical protein [Clostridiales bacterium]